MVPSLADLDDGSEVDEEVGKGKDVGQGGGRGTSCWAFIQLGMDDDECDKFLHTTMESSPPPAGHHGVLKGVGGKEGKVGKVKKARGKGKASKGDAKHASPHMSACVHAHGSNSFQSYPYRKQCV